MTPALALMWRCVLMGGLFLGVLVNNLHAEEHLIPLAPEALVKDVELFPYEGLSPSPDGQWVIFQTSDPGKKIQFDYTGQRFTHSGYPMLAGAAASQTWVTEVATGKSIPMSSVQGSSWSGSWSADSRYLAFYSDRGGQVALWVWDRLSGDQKQVSPASIRSVWWRQRPLWSADGKTLLCLLLPEGKSFEDMLKLAPNYPVPKPQATDSASTEAAVHVYSHKPLENAEQSQADTANAPSSAMAFYDAFFGSDLASIDVASGKTTRLAKKLWPIGYAYSPDKTRVAIMNIEESGPTTQQGAYNIKIYDSRDQSVRTVAKGSFDPNNLTIRMTWSPNGAALAYSDTSKTGKRACYVVDIKTGKKTEVSAQIPAASRDFSWGPPLWDQSGQWLYLLDSTAGRLWTVKADGRHTRELIALSGLVIRDLAAAEFAGTYWSPDGGKTMYVRTNDIQSKKDAFYAISVATGAATKIFEDDVAIGMREMGALVGLSGKSGTLVFSMESAAQPADVWALDLATKKTRPLSKLNSQYSAATMGRVQIIDWISLRGEGLKGSLLLPANYRAGQHYPLVLWVYGGNNGSEAANRFAFGWGAAFNPQMWASRGYAVLYPDVPLHPGTPVDDLVSAVIPGINKAVELGIADPERLAVMGQSFGGYNTVALITRTKIFKAAVAMSAGATDLFEGHTRFEAGLSNAGYYEEGQGGMKGTPWQFKERYYANSPLFFLDLVETPLLIQRGLLDGISVANGNIFNGLRSLNKTVEFLEYEHEDHVLQQPANVIDFWNRRITWLERYLP